MEIFHYDVLRLIRVLAKKQYDFNPSRGLALDYANCTLRRVSGVWDKYAHLRVATKNLANYKNICFANPRVLLFYYRS